MNLTDNVCVKTVIQCNLSTTTIHETEKMAVVDIKNWLLYREVAVDER